MTTPDTAYNYDTFKPGPYIDGACDGPEPGEPFGRHRVLTPASRALTLGELIDEVTVIETGSTTCPLYCANVSRMRAVAQHHEDVRFMVLYTREAHPGGRRGSHSSLEDKLHAAAGLREETGEWREVVVDDLDGPLHRLLAGSPNSVLILDADARVISWMNDTDPGAVDRVLAGVREGYAVSPNVSFRPPAPHVAISALLRGGFKAVWEFVLALPALTRYRLAGGSHC